MATIPSHGSSRRNQLKGKEESRSNFITIDTLPDELLIEIFIRLGFSKDAIRCKAVSKHWKCIVNNPLFKSCFLNYCRQKNQPLPVAFVKACVWPHKRDGLQPPWFSLTFLIEGSQHDPRLTKFHVLGTCKDLLLVGCYHSARNFYICNPQTTQWRAIPSSPSIFWKDNGVLTGFICNASNYQDFSQKLRCRIVLISLRYPPGYQKVEIFFSETGKWREVTLPFPHGKSYYFARDMETNGIPVNGMLYWMSLSRGCVIQMNPFSLENNVIYCSVISLHLLDRYFREFSMWRLTAVEGRLRLVSFTPSSAGSSPRYLRVFELENERSANGVEFWQCVYELSPKCSKHIYGTPELCFFHPANGAIMYFFADFSVFMCDMQRRTLDFICADSVKIYKSLPFELQWWPTWIPPLS